MHKFTAYLPFLALSLCCSCAETREVKLESPDGSYVFNCFLNEEGDEILYSLDFQGRETIKPSLLGYTTSENVGAQGKIIVRDVARRNIDTTWRPVYGEKDLYPDVYHQVILDIEEMGKEFRLWIRAYDEGVAFRCEFTHANTHIIEEKTEFTLPGGSILWASERAQSEVCRIPVEDVANPVDRPVLAQLPDSLFVAIGEAGLVDFARMKFARPEDEPSTLCATLDSEVEYSSPFKTPWRFIMAAEKPGEILENNYLLLNLNEPNRIKDASWIKPGKVIREVTLTTNGGKACVDFAAKHNLQFVEFDAGWYGHEYNDSSDATTVTVDPIRSKGPLDLPEVIRHAGSKGIGIILYVNRRALENQLDEILPLYRSWQFVYWYDRPVASDSGEAGAGGSKNRIVEVPELDFIDKVPTVWNDTRVIEGYPGEFVVIARRSGHRWFIGAINGSRDRDFEIPLEFLDPGQEYTATLYFDDAGLATLTRVGVERQTFVSHDRIYRKINAGNGLAIILEKKTTP